MISAQQTPDKYWGQFSKPLKWKIEIKHKKRPKASQGDGNEGNCCDQNDIPAIGNSFFGFSCIKDVI